MTHLNAALLAGFAAGVFGALSVALTVWAAWDLNSGAQPTARLQIELINRPNTPALPKPWAGERPSLGIQSVALPEPINSAFDASSALDSAKKTFDTVNTILNSAEVSDTVRQLPALTQSLRQTLQRVDREAETSAAALRSALTKNSRALQKTLNTLQQTAQRLEHESSETLKATRAPLARADAVLADARTLTDPRGQTMMQLQRGVDDLAETAARLREITDRFGQNPGMLLGGAN